VPRKTKIIAFSVPPSIYEEVVSIARKQNKTKSELFRDMVRLYSRYQKMEEQEELNRIFRLIMEAKEEVKRKGYDNKEEWNEFERLQKYGLHKSKELDINSEEEIERLIDEQRQAESNMTYNG